jgi:hypothetical protein
MISPTLWHTTAIFIVYIFSITSSVRFQARVNIKLKYKWNQKQMGSQK